jgi:hypothetical protein
MLNKKLKNVGIERYMQFLIYVDVLPDDIFFESLLPDDVLVCLGICLRVTL